LTGHLSLVKLRLRMIKQTNKLQTKCLTLVLFALLVALVSQSSQASQNTPSIHNGFPNRNQIDEFIKDYSLRQDSVPHLERAMNDLPELPILGDFKLNFILRFNDFLDTGNVWAPRKHLEKDIKSNKNTQIWKENLQGLRTLLKFSIKHSHFRHVLTQNPYGKIELTIEILNMSGVHQLLTQLEKPNGDFSNIRLNQNGRTLGLGYKKPVVKIRFTYLLPDEHESAFKFKKSSLQELLTIRKFQAFVPDGLNQDFTTNTSLNPATAKENFRSQSEIMRVAKFLQKNDLFMALKIQLESEKTPAQISDYLTSIEDFEIKRKRLGPFWSDNPKEYFDSHRKKEIAFRNSLEPLSKKAPLWNL